MKFLLFGNGITGSRAVALPRLYCLLFLILADLGYSFMQYQHQAFGGDLVPLIHPSEHNATILNNPFGIKAIQEDVRYAGVNRYFAHKSLALYFKNIPQQLQLVFEPIDSVYLSAAIFKLLSQVLLTYLICAFALKRFKLWSLPFLGLFLLLSTFFQTYGYYHNIGIIDTSITYVFFYAFPIAMLLWFLFFIYQRIIEVKAQKLLWWEQGIILALIVYLPFSGGIIPPLSLMLFGFTFFALIYEGILMQIWEKISLSHKGYIFLYLCLSCYSYYLSGYNLENQSAIGYWEGLHKCLHGLFFIGTSKLAIPLLLSCLLVNGWVLKKHRMAIPYTTKRAILWLWAFLLLYLLLLPLGGFRDYRPNLIRHDTFIPVTLGFFYTIGVTTYLVYQRIGKHPIYLSFIGLIMLLFTIADRPHFDNNECERKQLLKIQENEQKILNLPADCTIFSWNPIENIEDSRMIGNMLQSWNIVEQEVLFKQVKEE